MEYSAQDTNGTLISDGAHTVQLEIYTVLVGVIIMLVFGALGLLSNVGLLMAVRCMNPTSYREYTRGYRPATYYAIPCALAIINILFSLIWVPLDIMRLLLNYNQVGLHYAACYADQAILIFWIVVVVLLHVFFAMQHFIKYCMDIGHATFISTAIAVTIILGILFAGCAVTTFHNFIDYKVCVQESPMSKMTDYSALPLVAILAFLSALLITMILMACVILWRQRCKLAAYRRTRCRKNRKISDNVGSQSGKEEAQERFLEPNSSDNQESRSSRKSSKAPSGSSSRQLICIKDNPDDKESGSHSGGDQKNPEESEDDDEFDQKMKLRLQKSLSGRRHTVANISLGLTSSLNKTSSQDSVNRSPSPFNYTYVRKWSVDIQALQDQLENPKGLLGANPFGLTGSFKRDKHIPSTHSIEEKPEGEETDGKDEHKEGADKPKDIFKPKECRITKEKIDRTRSDVTSNKSKDLPSVGVKFEPISKIPKFEQEAKCDKVLSSSGSEVRFKDTIEEHVDEAEDDDICDNEVENVNKAAVKDLKEENEDTALDADGILTFPEPDALQTDKVANGNQGDAMATLTGDCKPMDALVSSENDHELHIIKCIREITMEMHINWQILLMLLVVTLCTLPYCTLQMMVWSMPLSLNRNLCWILAGVSIFQLPLHVALLAWVERSLQRAMRKLWRKLTNWKCVCYCNIGKGKHCFDRPGYREPRPAV